MPKSTTSKTPSKTNRKKASNSDPRLAIKRTVASASKLVESMLAAIEEDLKKPVTSEAKTNKKEREIDRMFGPRGAIANLHKLMQVLDKLSDQLGMLEDGKKKLVARETLSREEIKLIEEWLKQP
jgi:hypothetical protein